MIVLSIGKEHTVVVAWMNHRPISVWRETLNRTSGFADILKPRIFIPVYRYHVTAYGFPIPLMDQHPEQTSKFILHVELSVLGPTCQPSNLDLNV